MVVGFSSSCFCPSFTGCIASCESKWIYKVVLRVNWNVAAIIACAILNRGLLTATDCYARKITSRRQTER